MARYTGPVCKLCRREGVKLYLKGERCYTGKCSVERRAYAPGQHGQARRKASEYALHLREKQKARRIYGVLERQFRRYVGMAGKAYGVTGEALLQILERRLDNVVYRMGFAGSRAEARQLVSHGHFTVNGRRVNIPSYLVRPGDEVAVHEKSRDVERIKEMVAQSAGRAQPEWLSVDREAMKGNLLRLPTRDEIDVPVKEHFIVEHYSR